MRRLGLYLAVGTLLLAISGASAATLTFDWKGQAWKYNTSWGVDLVQDGGGNAVLTYTGATEYTGFPYPCFYLVVPAEIRDAHWTTGVFFQVSYIESPVIDDNGTLRQAGAYIATENSGYSGTKYAFVGTLEDALSDPATTGNENIKALDNYAAAGSTGVARGAGGTVHTVRTEWLNDAKHVNVYVDGALAYAHTEPTYIPVGQPNYVYLSAQTDGIAKSVTFTDFQMGAIPEPVSLSLLGLGGLALLRRRR